MKKMSGTLLVFVLCTLLAQAQKHQPANQQKDQMVFKGYTIRVIPAMMGTYGYNIFKDRKLVLHQRNNPFTGGPAGLRNKEDVFKAAQWQIEYGQQPVPTLKGWLEHMQGKYTQSQKGQLKTEPVKQESRFINKIPMPVAGQLHINLNSH